MPARYAALYTQTDPLAFPVSPTAIPIRLIGDNPFDGINAIPQFAELTSQETQNRIYDIESTRFVVRGKLSTYLYPTQADALIGWATDVTSGELSAKAIQYFDGVAYKQFLGLYVEQLTLSCSAEQEEGLVKADFDLVGIKPGTAITIGDFPAISASAYPATNAYKLYETKGGFIAIDSGSAARTKYQNLTITIKNSLSANWDEDQYISDCTYHGRRITIESNVRYTAASDRTLFEAKTPIKVSVEWTKVLSGGSPNTHALKLDFLLKNRITGLDKSLPLAKPGYQKLMLTSVLDPTSGTGNDLTRTVTFT